MNASFIMLIVLTAVRLWIAAQLFVTARKSRLTNLDWLAGVFLLAAVYSVFTPISTSPLGNTWIFILGFIAGHFCLTMFIHTTFYHDRKSPVTILIGLVVLAFFVAFYALSINDLNLAGIMTAVGLVNWTWHLFVARSAYAAIAKDPSVENWVKARYRLMIVYVLLITLSTIQVVLSSTSLSPLISGAVLPISILVILGSIILQFLVWVMPEPFRLWLNRDQRARQEEGQRPLSILDVFGAAMTADTGLKSMACLYAIRAAVAKKIDSNDSAAIQTQINTMTYQEWDSVLQHPELRRILTNTGADPAAAEKAIQNARQALVEKQSLLTLGAR